MTLGIGPGGGIPTFFFKKLTDKTSLFAEKL